MDERSSPRICRACELSSTIEDMHPREMLSNNLALLGLFRSQGDPHGKRKGAALPWYAFHPDLAPFQLHDSAGDAQAQARSSDIFALWSCRSV